jgi:hypothetical protein
VSFCVDVADVRNPAKRPASPIPEPPSKVAKAIPTGPRTVKPIPTGPKAIPTGPRQPSLSERSPSPQSEDEMWRNGRGRGKAASSNRNGGGGGGPRSSAPLPLPEHNEAYIVQTYGGRTVLKEQWAENPKAPLANYLGGGGGGATNLGQGGGAYQVQEGVIGTKRLFRCVRQ